MIKIVTVTAKRRFTAPLEKVFDAWLDPRIARAWLFTLPGHLSQIKIDPREGGVFSVTDQRQGGDITHEGEYLEIERPGRLRFRLWLSDMPAEKDTVTAVMEDDGDGTMVTISHQLAPAWADFPEQTRLIWTEMLDTLAERLAG